MPVRTKEAAVKRWSSCEKNRRKQEMITEDIRYIGVNDHDIDLFEGSIRCQMVFHITHT